MIKRKTIETVEEYDANGKLTRKVTTETNEDDNSPQVPYVPTYPNWWWTYPQVTYGNDKTESVPWWVSHPWQITCGDPPGSCGSGSISSTSTSGINVKG
jgi:hypothetical protein